MTNKQETSSKPVITPEMKVGEFLKYYPELEDVLIGIAPVFAKLKNPILRKTIAKVASLNQAAAVGDVSIGEMINTLRRAAGDKHIFDSGGDAAGTEAGKPSWFDISKVKYLLDARPIIDRGEHPLGEVIKNLNRMPIGEIYELITPFYPAPLIDKVKALGFEAWSHEEGDNVVKSYFYKQTKNQ
jgi:uncharacterized protein (DUF2249 family)